METIRSFEQMTSHLANLKKRIRFAVVCAADACTQRAAERALSEGFAHIIWVGCTKEVVGNAALLPYSDHMEYVETEHPGDAVEASWRAVELIHEGRADVVMKGLVNTDVMLRAVLNKEKGLLPAGRVLTHIALAQIPQLNRLLFFTDAAVIPQPNAEQRKAQLTYVVQICQRFGIAQPKIALIHCSEKVSEKFPHTLEYAELCQSAREGKWGDCIVDGPLDLRTTIDEQALRTKGISSPLEGNADALIFPNIEAGNVFYKTITFLGKADIAGILQGTLCPVVLSSRGDSTLDKYHSMALAAMSR